MNFSLLELSKRINNLPTNYELTAVKSELHTGEIEEEAIAHWLHGLTTAELNIVLRLLNKTGNTNYIKYFKNK